MRIFLKRVHRWLAIPVIIIIPIICLSGAALVFQDEILELANPSHYFVKETGRTPLPLEELIPMVNAQLDSNSVASVQIFHDPERTYRATLKEGFRISAFVNPYTGEITGIYKFQESPFYTIMRLHRWLLDSSRSWGKYAVGISTLLFTFILISGFALWWPRRISKNRFAVSYKHGRKRLLYDLHNVLGAYACIVLLTCSLTGMMWSFEWYRNGVFKILGADVPVEKAREPIANREDKRVVELDISHWQGVLGGLKTSNPDYEYIRIQDGSATVHLQTANLSRNSDNYNFVASSGEIVKTTLFRGQKGTTKIWAWVYSLHVGNYWGVWSKTFTFIFSIIGASLPITGWYIHRNRRKKRAKRWRENRRVRSSMARVANVTGVTGVAEMTDVAEVADVTEVTEIPDVADVTESD